jgi:hypothetical protein
LVSRFEDFSKQLLDPVDKDDPNLLSFNLEGRALPAPHEHDEWERTRVEYSVLCAADFYLEHHCVVAGSHGRD